MSTRDELAAVIDPDVFDGDKPKSKAQVAILQWAARRKMAFDAADAILAAGWKSPAEVEAALAEQREGIARAIHDYADAAWDLIDSPNGARLAFAEIERIARTYTQEAGK